MKITRYIVAIYSCCFFATACNQNNNQSVTIPSDKPTNLNAIQITLPEAPGYQAFQMNCISCHSARYVQMQPDLPEKTWTAIVTKMQKNFGAPLEDSSAREIVQYLTAIKGKK